MRQPFAITSQIAGISIAAIGSITLSFSAVMIRQIEEATSWQIIFYRSIGLFFGLSTLFALRNWGQMQKAFKDSLPRALAAGPFQGGASIFYILSLTHTTIANAMITLAATPLVVAAIGWAFLGERVSWSTWGALFLAGAGIALMTSDGVRGGMGLGSFFAIVNVVSFAIYIVQLRRGSRSGNVDMLPALLIGALTAGTVSLLALSSFSIGMHDLLICFLWGACFQTVGMALVMTSARFISAAEISLMVLFESVCGPLWAWLIVDEAPRPMTVLGGALTVVTIAAWILIRTQQERLSRKATAAIATESVP